MSPQKYVQDLRIHIECLFGADLKSIVLKEIEFSKNNSPQSHKIDVVRFQQIHPHKLPIKDTPFIDLFVDPFSGIPSMTTFREGVSETFQLTEESTKGDLESVFASIIWGSKRRENEVAAPIRNVYLQ